ncbi:hypothetical protein QTN25_001867 [Entamoeba marina]
MYCPLFDEEFEQPLTKTSYKFCQNHGFSTKYSLIGHNKEVLYTTSGIFSFNTSFKIFNCFNETVAMVKLKRHNYQALSKDELPFEVKFSKDRPQKQVLHVHFPPDEDRTLCKKDFYLESVAPHLVGKRYFLQFSQPTEPSLRNFQLISPQQTENTILFEFMKQKGHYKVVTHEAFTPLQTFILCIVKSHEIATR